MKRFLLFGIFLVPTLLFAQSNFKKGFIVTNDGDTIRGEIDYRESQRNLSNFNFRKDGEKAVNYNSKDCSAYGVDAIDNFESHQVDISQSKVLISEVSKGLDSSKVTESVFLRVLQSGKHLTLFSYTDKIKKRFYIKTSFSSPFELLQPLYYHLDKQGVLVTSRVYRRQLLAAFKDVNQKKNPGLERKIAFVSYEEGQLKRLISQINEQNVSKSKYRTIRFLVGGGVINSNAVFSGRDRISIVGTNSANYMPYINAGVDAFFNPAVGKMIFRTEFSAFKSKTEINLTSVDYEKDPSRHYHAIDASNILLAPQVVYNFYNKPNIKIFAGVGVGINYSSYSKNSFSVSHTWLNPTEVRTRDNYVKLEDVYFTLPISTGVVFKKKIEISLGYTPKSLISPMEHYQVGVERYRLGFNYLFGKY